MVWLLPQTNLAKFGNAAEPAFVEPFWLAKRLPKERSGPPRGRVQATAGRSSSAPCGMDDPALRPDDLRAEPPAASAADSAV